VRGRALITVVRQSLARGRRAAFSSLFGIVVGVSSLVFFVGLGLGVARLVREDVFPVEATLVEVLPSQLSLGVFGGDTLDAATVARLAALPGVKHAWRKMNVRVPAVVHYDDDFFGRRLRLRVELLAVGVDPGFLKADLPPDRFVDPGGEGPIPVLASSRLLEIYNGSFARARSLPQLNPAMLSGFTFPAEFNRSLVMPVEAAPVIRAQLQMVGLSPRALLTGVSMPLAAAARLNRLAGDSAERYSSVVVEANDASRVPALVAAVKAMGLRIDDEASAQSERVGAAVAITTGAMALLSLLICLLAAFNIAHALAASVRARERELAVMQAVGASRRDLFLVVLAEAGALGLAGGLLGTGVGLGLALGANAVAVAALPEFPFKPDSFFLLPPALLLGGLAVGLVATLAGAVGPARQASAVDPARALAGQAA
jgi:putative ABC transport system permease protein